MIAFNFLYCSFNSLRLFVIVGTASTKIGEQVADLVSVNLVACEHLEIRVYTLFVVAKFVLDLSQQVQICLLSINYFKCFLIFTHSMQDVRMFKGQILLFLRFYELECFVKQFLFDERNQQSLLGKRTSFTLVQIYNYSRRSTNVSMVICIDSFEDLLVMIVDSLLLV